MAETSNNQAKVMLNIMAETIKNQAKDMLKLMAETFKNQSKDMLVAQPYGWDLQEPSKGYAQP